MQVIRFVLICGVFLLFTTGLSAQGYTSAVGARLGSPLSLSYKTFISTTDAVEVYAGLRPYRKYGSFSLNGAYQIHADLSEVDGLQWYYGAGAGFQVWSYRNYDRGSSTFSLSGYLGLEYLIPDFPLSVTLDWVPTLFVGRHRVPGFNRFGPGYGAVGIRYILD